MNHSFITAVIPFAACCAGDVTRLLDAMGNPATADIERRLNGTNRIHFMGIHVLPGERNRAYLMVDASADGSTETALRHLEDAMGPELRALILAAGVEMDGQGVAELLCLHCIRVSNAWFRCPGIDFDGSPSMSVQRIKDEDELAREITSLLDKPVVDLTALQRLQQIRATLWNSDARKWAFFAEPAPFLLDVPPAPPLKFRSIVTTLVGVIWRPLSFAVLAGWLGWKFLSPDWGIGAAGLTFALGIFVQGKPPPDQVTASVIWLSVELMFWPLLLAVVVASGLTWWLAGAGWWLLGVFLASAILFGLLPFGVYLILLRKEKSDVPENLAPNAESIGAMMARESFTAQNLLAAASTVKPGFIRKITLRFGLAAADIAARFYSKPGFLTDIGVIHFARWFVLPGTDKLMFLSNYDGAWESYLEDFIERGYRGVTGIWSNTVGFPRTSQLLNGGARDGDRLRRWTRRQMFPVRFWYTAYPHLTLLRIRINAQIRQGLASVQTEEAATKWLALFGSASASDESISRRRPRLTQLVPRQPVKTIDQPDEGIELENVPTPLLGAMSHLPFGTIILIRFGCRGATEWLQEIRHHVTFGSCREEQTAMVLGISHSGLEELGLGPDDLATFPVPFQHGNHAPWRARALGDVRENAPNRWKWGGVADKRVDASIVIYARDQQTHDALVDARTKEIARLGHQLVRRIQLRQLPASGPSTEPFGYVDGISQPLIRGIRRSVPEDQLHQVVAPGEFILGYRDHQNFVPPSPTVADHTDRGRLLPAAPETAGLPPGARPVDPPQGRRDLGRNGTFMVLRQLEQDVVSFDGFLNEAAATFATDPRVFTRDATVPLQDWLGAKIVGRWKDGSSLTNNPSGPAAGPGGLPPDNNFTYGPNDSSGGRCPLGAHVRRANPRGSFEPAATDGVQLAITNRHRILRFGRAYEQEPKENPGLMFMCLNVDIERQFEFIQQTWLLAPSFHGLEHERDLILSGRDGGDHYTIPTENGPLRLPCLSEFIRVLGGGYFFLPGRHALQYLAQD